MATSPNYGWSEPDNTSLVKDGALAMRTLGDAIDTSVWNVGYGQSGKNRIINGDFGINQRNFTSVTADNTYTFDRFITRIAGDGTATFTPQTFTSGAAPAAPYESTNFLRIVTAGQSTTASRALIRQYIEDVRTFAGQTVTISFWAKAATGTPKIAVLPFQAFGSGGSAAVNVPAGAVTISTSWARYSATIAIPSISGKTIGAGNTLGIDLAVSAGADFATNYSSIGIQNGTFDIWGVQVEYGSKATPFQTASGGSIQGELAMCQRYYWRTSPSVNGNFASFGSGTANTITTAKILIQNPVPMRTFPSSVDSSTLRVSDGVTGSATGSVAIDTDQSNANTSVVTFTGSGLVIYRPYLLQASSSNTAYIGFSAEL